LQTKATYCPYKKTFSKFIANKITKAHQENRKYIIFKLTSEVNYFSEYCSVVIAILILKYTQMTGYPQGTAQELSFVATKIIQHFCAGFERMTKTPIF